MKGSKMLFRLAKPIHNEKGAIDLASIMVGIVVIGLVGGVIAGTVFAVIPWAQDNAAKQQLDAIVASQSAYMGLSSGVPPVVPTGHSANSYANSAELEEASLLKNDDAYCVTTINGGKNYQAVTKSGSGKLWMVTDGKSSPIRAGSWNLPDNCLDLLAGNKVIDLAYTDPTPKTTTIRYKCDVSSLVTAPIRDGVGVATWSDGTTSAHKGDEPITKTLEAGVEYKLTFEGTYKKLANFIWSLESSSTVDGADCLRGVEHWGAETGVSNINLAYAENLVDVPPFLPSTVSSVSNMFTGSTSINDPDISKWNVSRVSNMNHMFRQADKFNQPLNHWDVSKVTTMTHTFKVAWAFNQPLNDWDVSKVRTMEEMFNGAPEFNHPLDKWQVSQVVNMNSMFEGSGKFNQNLSNWNTSSLKEGENFASSGFATEYMPRGANKVK